MTRPLASYLLAVLVGATSLAAAQAPSITIQSPATDAVIPGVAIIRFRVESLTIASPFATPAPDGLGPIGHLHVTVDGAAWHWMHTSAEPVVITPLPPGVHTVTLELAAADHRPITSTTVRFTIGAKVPSMTHPVVPPKSR